MTESLDGGGIEAGAPGPENLLRGSNPRFRVCPQAFALDRSCMPGTLALVPVHTSEVWEPCMHH